MILRRLARRDGSEPSPSERALPRPEDVPDELFQTVARVGEIGPGEMKYVELGAKAEPVVLINLDGSYYALSDTCTHEDASLSDGEIVGDEIECPLHGGAFEIRTGLPAGFPVVVPAKVYPVRVVGDEVQVADVP